MPIELTQHFDGADAEKLLRMAVADPVELRNIRRLRTAKAMALMTCLGGGLIGIATVDVHLILTALVMSGVVIVRCKAR